MIEKERLKKLLKEHKVVYSIDTKCYCTDILDLHNNMSKIDYDDYGNVKLFTSGSWWHWFNLKDLFETKEDAEFALKYQNITRAETLNLPTWEEIENDYIEPNIILFHRFMKKDNTEAELVVDCFDNKIEVLGVGGAYNIWEATKANYLEACELCRKLFLGESK